MTDSLLPATAAPTEVETKLRVDVQTAVDEADNVILLTRNDLSVATDIVKAIKTRLKTIEDERTKITKPINAGLDQLNARFRAIAAPLLQAESTLKGKMLKFQQEEEARAEAERKKEEEAQRKAQAEARAREEAERKASPPKVDAIEELLKPEEPALPAVPPPVSSYKPTTYGQSGATSTVQKRWTWELIDVKKLATSNPEWVMADSVKLNKAVQAGVREIPGVRVYQKDVIQVK